MRGPVGQRRKSLDHLGEVLLADQAALDNAVAVTCGQRTVARAAGKALEMLNTRVGGGC